MLFLGFGLHGQREHAPDEWLSVTNFERAANASTMFLLTAADLPLAAGTPPRSRVNRAAARCAPLTRWPDCG